MLNRFRAWRGNEHGASTITIFILAMPLIVGSFGFGFDQVRALYFKNYIQNRADLAVQNAVALNSSTKADGTILLGEKSILDAQDNYTKNTRQYRGNSVFNCFLTWESSATGCSQSVGKVGNSGDINCKDLFLRQEYGLKLEIREKVNTVFLRILGINELNLGTITAKSIVRPVCS